MGLTVYGGGGKPEEERTVTAGTSAIEVNPSSGKVMKKVTVNPTPTESKSVTAGTSDITVSPIGGKHLIGVTVHPTPSQEKTVIPTADGFKVSPDIGKLLSAVFVDGDSDLVGENIKQGVNIFGVDGSFDNSHGAYVWKKLTAQGGDFLDFVVSDDPTAYPDGGEQGGYWYEKAKEVPILKGDFTVASKTTIPIEGIGTNKPNFLRLSGTVTETYRGKTYTWSGIELRTDSIFGNAINGSSNMSFSILTVAGGITIAGQWDYIPVTVTGLTAAYIE